MQVPPDSPDTLRSKRHRRLFIAVAAVAVGLTVVSGVLWTRSILDPAAAILAKASVRADGSVTPLSEADMLRLYDISRSERRKKDLMVRVRKLSSGRISLFAPHCIDERIIHLGKAPVIEPLIALAQDGAQDTGARRWAIILLSKFNDERAIRALLSIGEADPELAYGLVFMLPLDERSPYLQPGGMAAMSRDMEGKTFAEFTLVLLDAWVKDPNLTPGDNAILRWLNRYFGYDFDDLIAQPDVTAFRVAQLRRGYDPLTYRNSDLAHLIANYEKGYQNGYAFYEKGLAEVFAIPAERETCKALISAYDRTWLEPYSSRAQAHWRERLLAWYTAARPYLKYDEQLGRFEVKADEGTMARIQESVDAAMKALPEEKPKADPATLDPATAEKQARALGYMYK